MPLSAGTRLGIFEILAPLGKGGMGEVYRAKDTKLSREVAIKVLPESLTQDPERLARFQREATLLAALNHPHIASIYGLEEADGNPFLVLELAPGEDLSERIERGPIPIDEALEIARQIAEALEEAHEHGIVHRDLKPANIKVTPDGKVKVLDFGLAKAYAADEAAATDVSQSPTMSARATAAGLLLGTAAYMSPEQARGKPVDKRTDIWAFGVVLFEMLTGKRLFSGETVSDTLASILKEDPWPQWLPGSDDAVLYTAHTGLGGYDDANIVVETVSDGARKVVHAGGYYGRYLPSGHLVFVHQGTLFAAPFDLEKLETSGAGVPAVEGMRVTPGRAGAQFAFSENGTFIYVAGEDPTLSGPIHWLGRDGTTTPLRPEPANWTFLSFSPSGDRLAMHIHDGSQWDVRVLDLSRDTLSRLTSDSAMDALPVWTPDGRRITFVSVRSGTDNLYWRRSDGSGVVQRLTESEGQLSAASWHPTDQLLAFGEQRPDTGWDLMTLEVAGDEATGWEPRSPEVFLETSFQETHPVFSPDGHWLAYVSDESGEWEVYVRPFPGSPGKWQVSRGGGTSPRWSRSRPELLYAAGRRIMVVPYTVDAATFLPGKPEPWPGATFVPRGPGVGNFDVHPDGQRLALWVTAETPAGDAHDSVVFITNFFDELRRLSAAEAR